MPNAAPTTLIYPLEHVSRPRPRGRGASLLRYVIAITISPILGGSIRKPRGLTDLAESTKLASHAPASALLVPCSWGCSPSPHTCRTCHATPTPSPPRPITRWNGGRPPLPVQATSGARIRASSSSPRIASICSPVERSSCPTACRPISTARSALSRTRPPGRKPSCETASSSPTPKARSLERWSQHDHLFAVGGRGPHRVKISPYDPRAARLGGGRLGAADLQVHPRRQAAGDDARRGRRPRHRPDALQRPDRSRVAARRQLLRGRRLRELAHRQIRPERQVP